MWTHVGQFHDPKSKKDIHVAVRLLYYHSNPYDLAFTKPLEQQMAHFELAHSDGEAPYFVGIVTWKFKERIVAGFIVEDVTDNKKHGLVKDPIDFQFELRTIGNKQKRYLLVLYF